MPSKQRVLTPDQVKQSFKDRGVTISQWSRDRGYVARDVYRVLNGQLKANWGKAHEIAVALGLKPSISEDFSNPQAKAAA